MKCLIPFLFLALICGCNVLTSNRRQSNDETKHWEAVIRSTSSLEDLFEASYHLNYYFPEEFHRIGDEKSYSFLISKLKSTDPKVRDNAASCLRGFPYGDRNSELIKAYGRETIEDVKLGLLLAMCNTNGSPEVVKFLTDILASDDNRVRWSAARSLSAIAFPKTDELLARFKNDADPRVREEVESHFKEKETQITITEAEATQLLEVAARLISSDKSNRVVQISLFPAEIGNRKIQEARVYEEVLLIRLFEPDGGLIINPLEVNSSPAINKCWITPTGFTGIVKYESLF